MRSFRGSTCVVFKTVCMDSCGGNGGSRHSGSGRVGICNSRSNSSSNSNHSSSRHGSSGSDVVIVLSSGNDDRRNGSSSSSS